MSEPDPTASNIPAGAQGMFIPIPDTWDDMTPADQQTWMTAALTKIGQSLGLVPQPDDDPPSPAETD